MSGSKLFLNDKKEITIVMGDITSNERPIVVIVIEIIARRSDIVAFKNNRPNIDANAPIIIALSRVKAIMVCIMI